MKENLFTIEDSLKLAKSITKRSGISIQKDTSLDMPRVYNKTIVMGDPSVYSHVEYMENLHKCIGACCTDNDFFDQVVRDGREDTLKEILKSMHTDRFMLGQYSGRDRQLAANYRRNFSALQENLHAISEDDPTAAALLALGNELRNDWQSFNKLQIPPDLEPKLDKLRKIKDRWLSLETAKDLENLLKLIEEIENERDETEDGEAEAEGSEQTSDREDTGEQLPERGDSESGNLSGEDEGATEGDGDSPDREGKGDDPRDASEAGGQGEGGSKEEAGGSSPSGEIEEQEGGDSNPSEQDTEPGESSEGDLEGGDSSESEASGDAEGDEGSREQSGNEDQLPDNSNEGDVMGESGADQDGSGEQSGDSGSKVGDGGTQASDKDSPEPSTDGQPEDIGAREGDPGPTSGTRELAEVEEGESSAEPSSPVSSYADTRDQLRELGILPDLEEYQETKYAYKPQVNAIIQDNRKPCAIDEGLSRDIAEMLKDFRLTQQVRKYLLVMSQDRWQTGLKQGKLNGSRISRMYSHSGVGQPRMFKRKEATRMSTNIGISLLIDQSGSMLFRDGKYVTAAACAIGMSEVLQSLQIPHEILMFTTDRRPSLVHTIVKDFAEPFVSRDRLVERMCRMNIRFAENGDGEAVAWAMSRLMQRKEQEKLLIVLSDGEPSIYGAEGDPSVYLRDIVKEIDNAKGIEAFGIGIKSSAVSRYYSKYKVVNNLKDLEPAFMSLLKDKLLK